MYYSKDNIALIVSQVISESLSRIISKEDFSYSFHDLGMDSLQIVCMFCELEERLQIELKLEEIIVNNATTPNDVVAYITSRVKK